MNPLNVDLSKLNDALADEEMERFVRGDDGIKPSPMHNLHKQREVATERIKRYMRWIGMCDELIGRPQAYLAGEQGPIPVFVGPPLSYAEQVGIRRLIEAGFSEEEAYQRVRCPTPAKNK